MPQTVANKDVFDTVNQGVNESIRAKFGPPGAGGAPTNITAQIAVALMQLSLRYFAETGANKLVVRAFFDKLLDGDDEKPRGITQDGNRLILPGQKI